MLHFDYLLCDRAEIINDSCLIYGLYNQQRAIVKPKLVSVSSRNLYQIGDTVCALIEESHHHQKIEGNSDINLVFEFQVKAPLDASSSSGKQPQQSMVYGWSCSDLFEPYSFTLK